jgi:hypothetical protein
VASVQVRALVSTPEQLTQLLSVLVVRVTQEALEGQMEAILFFPVLLLRVAAVEAAILGIKLALLEDRAVVVPLPQAEQQV